MAGSLICRLAGHTGGFAVATRPPRPASNTLKPGTLLSVLLGVRVLARVKLERKLLEGLPGRVLVLMDEVSIDHRRKR
jgi:hypothetical protein